MRLILNETQLVSDSINNGYVDKKKPSNTIRLLAKYYLSKDMNRPQTINSIDAFLKKNYKGYNSVKWQNTIEKIVNSVHKDKDYTMFDIGDVNITKNELEKITAINNLKYEKLMFILLVYAKIYNKLNDNGKYWVNEELKYIFSDTKMAIKEVDQCKIIFDLSELGLIEVSKKVDCTNVHVLMADEESDIEIIINDFRNLVYYYLKWKGEKIINCEGCSILIKQTSNKHKYCNECAKEIKATNDRRIQKERYDNSRK